MCVCVAAAEIRPREITPGAFTAPTSSSFELRFSVEMVDGVARLSSTATEEVRLVVTLYHRGLNNLKIFCPELLC